MKGSERNPSVGIVTIFDCDNYGAELQAYALPRALRGRGFDARLIDYPFYKSPRFRRTPLAAPALPLAPANALKERVMAARRACLRRLAGKAARRRDAAFAAFRASIPRTEPFLSFDDLLRAPPAFDAYLTGSDQVWNPRMGATLRPYFLDFLPEGARRLAYAASFGVSALPPPVEAQYRRWLSRYEAIGCREASGAALAARLCPQTPVAHVLDPTLLLTAQEWRAVAAPPDAARPYLLVYELVRAPGLWPLARRWAAARGCPPLRRAVGAPPPGRARRGGSRPGGLRRALRGGRRGAHHLLPWDGLFPALFQALLFHRSRRHGQRRAPGQPAPGPRRGKPPDPGKPGPRP